MDTIQGYAMGLAQRDGFEASTEELQATLEELEKAQRRADRDFYEWTTQLELANKAMYASRSLEESAEEENRLAAVDLNTLQQRIDGMLVADARQGGGRSSTKWL